MAKPLTPRQIAKRDALNARVRAAGKLAAKIRRQDTLKQKAKEKRARESHEELKRKFLAPVNTPISIRDFPHKGKSLAQFFLDYEKDPAYAASIEARKLPGEKWAFQFEDKSGIPTSSVTVYENFEQMINETFRYHGVEQGGDVFHSARHSRKLYSKIKLLRWNKTATAWRAQATENTLKRRKLTKGKKNRRKK